MQPQTVIIHERLANWSRQVRPRFPGWPIRWAETRSRDDLVGASAGSPCPILIVDLGDRPARGLRDLDSALVAAPTALCLVLDPRSHPGIAPAAREIGATLTLSGVVVPPEVVGLLGRWLPLARLRSDAQGWHAAAEPDPDPWSPAR